MKIHMKNKVLIALLFAMFVLALNVKTEAKDLVLRVYSWQDYIDDGKDEDGNKIGTSVLEDWEKDYYERTGVKVTLIYDTFETNEVMLNTLKTGKTTYDLCCPSEYTIQKMIRDDMLEKYDYDGTYKYVENYNLYGSPYIKKIFVENDLEEYAIPYMWGTLGMIYNPEFVDEEDMDTWGVLWNPKYKNKSSAKDSVRDTMVAGVMYMNRDKLMALRSDYLNGVLDAASYNKQVSLIMNDTSDLEGLEKVLTEMKGNIFGLEVDSGKNDIVTGKISIDVAWSGDAVYSMDTAEEEEGVKLCYKVPLEGGNIWFDGWVMPKGANKELAQDFINFLCSPATASRNMDYIGYTTAIAGDDIFDLVYDWYNEEDGIYANDLSYFFGDTISSDRLTDGKAIIRSNERNRQLDTQFPSEEVITRCAVMADFKDQNDAVLEMWENFKKGSFSVWLIVGVVGGVVAVGVVAFIIKQNKSNKKKKRRH